MRPPVAGGLFAALACVLLFLQAQRAAGDPWRPALMWPSIASAWGAIVVFALWVRGQGHGGVSLDELVPWVPMIAGLVAFWIAAAIMISRRG